MPPDEFGGSYESECRPGGPYGAVRKSYALAMADRKSTPIDARTAIEQFQDYLAPQLDVYEQAVYLYILRHSRLIGKPGLKVELKTARHKLPRGSADAGAASARRRASRSCGHWTPRAASR